MIENRWRKKAKPAKLGRRRRRLFYIRSALITTAALTLVASSILLSHTPGLQVKEFSVSGNSTALTDDIVALARKIGRGAYLFVFPKMNIALYPREALASAILSEFPQLKAANISERGFTGLSIAVTERTPIGLWCGRQTSEGSPAANDCYFLDEDGYIYGKAPGFSGPVFVRFYGLDFDGEAVATQYLPPGTFRSLEAFFLQMRRLGLTVSSFTIKDRYDYEVDFSEGPYLLFARASDLTAVLQNLESVADSDALRGKLSTLEYLDLRFGNRVYYKER